MKPKSKIFYSNEYKRIANNIESLLNRQNDFLSDRTINSPRAVGDAIETIIGDNFHSILGNTIKEYSSTFARRAMADLAFTDKDGLYYYVDVKTHRLDTKFNMPNLTSVERLSRFYEDDSNYFTILKVDYEIMDSKTTKKHILFKHVTFVPIEFLGWDCLTIGALGWGQIQIANANIVKVIPKNSRKEWMLQLCDNLLEFYPKEIEKINERIIHFKKIKSFWEKKKD